MSAIQIEWGVPIPTEGRRGGAVYPFPDMRVGASFTLPKTEADKLGGAAKVWKRRHPGWNYTTRISGDVIRIWRTA
jgi:hypothetical protein